MFGCRKVKRMRKRKRLNENGPYSNMKFLINEKRGCIISRNLSNNYFQLEKTKFINKFKVKLIQWTNTPKTSKKARMEF